MTIKQLKLDLKKTIIIVEPPKGYDLLHYKDGDSRLGFANTDIANPYDDVLDLNVNEYLKLICKGDELTENILDSILKGMYEEHYVKSTNISQLYNSGLATYVGDPMEAFKKHVKEKGFWWESHNIKREVGFLGSISEMEKEVILHRHIRNYNEAKSKTFNPKTTYIFEYEKI